MKVTLKCTYVAGDRNGNRKEYHTGTVVDLPKAEAERLIAGQHARPVDTTVSPPSADGPS